MSDATPSKNDPGMSPIAFKKTAVRQYLENRVGEQNIRQNSIKSKAGVGQHLDPKLGQNQLKPKANHGRNNGATLTERATGNSIKIAAQALEVGQRFSKIRNESSRMSQSMLSCGSQRW